jgi:hypothetical protein
VAIATVAAALGACAAAPTPTSGGAVVVTAKGYRVVPPPGWLPVAGQADVAFRHPEHRGGLMAHATCDGKTARRPLPVLARHLRFGLRDVQDLDEATVQLAGRPGVRSRFTARLDGVPVAVGAVTLEARGCVYDLVVVAPPDELPAVADDFERFAASFALTEPRP